MRRHKCRLGSHSWSLKLSRTSGAWHMHMGQGLSKDPLHVSFYRWVGEELLMWPSRPLRTQLEVEGEAALSQPGNPVPSYRWLLGRVVDRGSRPAGAQFLPLGCRRARPAHQRLAPLSHWDKTANRPCWLSAPHGSVVACSIDSRHIFHR